MKHLGLRLGLAFAALVITFVESRPAQAGLEACGDVHIDVQAQCEVEVGGGCVARCEPLRVEAACAAELHANCEGHCEASATLECAASCEAECQASCEVDPGAFDCRLACDADCEGACAVSCDSQDSECWAACQGTCSAECESQCEIVPPRASCEGQCEASCEGSCRGRASLECQVDCQAEGFATCKADIVGGCEAQCRRPEGALFCDGQYIDHGHNLEECIDALRDQLDVDIEGEGEANFACADGTCTGDAFGILTCSVTPAERPPIALGVGAAFLLLSMGARRRQRSQPRPRCEL